MSGKLNFKDNIVSKGGWRWLAIHDYGGNAGDMGEGVSSKLTEALFGVGGATPVVETLPMNQDCKEEESILEDRFGHRETYRNPSAISTYLFHSLLPDRLSVKFASTTTHSRRTNDYTS